MGTHVSGKKSVPGHVWRRRHRAQRLAPCEEDRGTRALSWFVPATTAVRSPPPPSAALHRRRLLAPDVLCTVPALSMILVHNGMRTLLWMIREAWGARNVHWARERGRFVAARDLGGDGAQKYLNYCQSQCAGSFDYPSRRHLTSLKSSMAHLCLGPCVRTRIANSVNGSPVRSQLSAGYGLIFGFGSWICAGILIATRAWTSCNAKNWVVSGLLRNRRNGRCWLAHDNRVVGAGDGAHWAEQGTSGTEACSMTECRLHAVPWNVAV